MRPCAGAAAAAAVAAAAAARLLPGRRRRFGTSRCNGGRGADLEQGKQYRSFYLVLFTTTQLWAEALPW